MTHQHPIPPMPEEDLARLQPIELTEAEDERAAEAIDQAEREIEYRVSLRWQRDQVEVVKKAAACIGVPYQTYVKMAAFRQAIEDLKALRAVRAAN